MHVEVLIKESPSLGISEQGVGARHLTTHLHKGPIMQQVSGAGHGVILPKSIRWGHSPAKENGSVGPTHGLCKCKTLCAINWHEQKTATGNKKE